MNTAAVIVCAIIIAAPMIFTVVALVMGRLQKARALRPVEFYPPRGYSPIDVLIKYYGHRAKPHALFNPLMLYWASRGFITIEEDCKRGLKLTKIKNIEKPDVPRFTRGQAKNFEIEQKLFEKLFSRGKTFYTLAAHESYKKLHADFMSATRESAKASRSKKTQIFALISFLSAAAELIITTIIAAASLRDPVFLAMLFPIIGVFAFKAIPSGESFMTAIKYPFFAVWGGAPFLIVLICVPLPVAILLACAELTCVLIVTVLHERIDIRTEKSAELYGRIMAFKTFLEDAEKEKLEFLVEENPNYFFDILPFCYVLGITDKLKARFDRIALDGPSWYLGDLRNSLMF